MKPRLELISRKAPGGEGVGVGVPCTGAGLERVTPVGKAALAKRTMAIVAFLPR
jgi:hypothetical protein